MNLKQAIAKSTTEQDRNDVMIRDYRGVRHLRLRHDAEGVPYVRTGKRGAHRENLVDFVVLSRDPWLARFITDSPYSE